MRKALLFDFDGTISDSLDNFLEIINTLSAKYKFPPINPNDVASLRNEDSRTLIKLLKIPFYKIPFIARDMKKLQEKKILSLHPFKEIPVTLEKLKKSGYLMGILTSNGKVNVENFLKINNLELFDYIYCDASLFGKDKMILNFLKQNNISKEDVIYIGDEIRDIHASHKAGIKIISITWGFNSREGLSKYNPDYLVDIPEELYKLLESKNF